MKMLSSPTTNDERRRQEIAQKAHLARDFANTTVGLIEWKSNKRSGDDNISSSLIKRISHKDDMLSWALTEGGAA
jgi:late competence protein required for DNA uptake (superfamily II DNA/RNA helicase)